MHSSICCLNKDVLCHTFCFVEMLTANLPGMWERTVTIGSGGKSFSATGWKVAHDYWLGRPSLHLSLTSALLFVLGWVDHRLQEHHQSN